MKRLVVLSLLLGVALWFAGTASAEEFKPIAAAEAERRVAESRDALTDMLWIGLDVYWHEGRWDECVRTLREIIVIDPQFVEAYTNAAYLLWNSDRDDEAIAVYEQGLKANPDSADIYFDYGFFHRYRKHYDQAIALFRKVVEKGGNREQQHMLPNTLEEAGRKQEALDEWRLLEKRFPKDPVPKAKIPRLEAELRSEKEQSGKGETR